MALLHIRVPSVSWADRFARAVSHLSRPSGFYRDPSEASPAFGWAALGPMKIVYLAIDSERTVLIHPATDPRALSRLVNDLTARQLGVHLSGTRNGGTKLDFKDCAAPFAQGDYFASRAGKTMPLSDLFAPFVLTKAAARNVQPLALEAA